MDKPHSCIYPMWAYRSLNGGRWCKVHGGFSQDTDKPCDHAPDHNPAPAAKEDK